MVGTICCVLGLWTTTSCLLLHFVLVVCYGALQVSLITTVLIEAGLHDNIGGVGGRLHGTLQGL